MRRTAVLIVGGGPAGSAAAIMLGRAGLNPMLIERSEGPHEAVCGGFLGWDALALLDRIRFDPWKLGARPIDRVRLVTADRTVEARLPRRAAGLSRGTLDEALIQRASAAGGNVRRGILAKAVEPKRRVRLGSGEEIETDALFLATGKHDLRGVARPREALTHDPAIGFRGSLPCSPQLTEALTGVIELHLFDHGYAGLLLQEDGAANFCVSVSPGQVKRAGSIPGFVSELCARLPRLARRMDKGLPDVWDTVAGVPYGWRADRTDRGLFRLGDQGAVIASLVGDGIAIALASGIEAASSYLSHGPQGAELYQRRFARRIARPQAIAEGIRQGASRPGCTRLAMTILSAAPPLTSLLARATRVRAR